MHVFNHGGYCSHRLVTGVMREAITSWISNGDGIYVGEHTDIHECRARRVDVSF